MTSSPDHAFDPSPSGSLTCLHCGLVTSAHAPDGSPRQHCPGCLYAGHVDGYDDCRAEMRPFSIAVLRHGGWAVVQRCTARACPALAVGAVAEDDNQLVLVQLAVQPLAQPPFPLELFGQL